LHVEKKELELELKADAVEDGNLREEMGDFWFMFSGPGS